MIGIDEDIVGEDSYVPQSAIDSYYTLGIPFCRIFLETIQRENHIAIRIAQGSGIYQPINILIKIARKFEWILLPSIDGRYGKQTFIQFDRHIPPVISHTRICTFYRKSPVFALLKHLHGLIPCALNET
jgi:hypothetical protein